MILRIVSLILLSLFISFNAYATPTKLQCDVAINKCSKGDCNACHFFAAKNCPPNRFAPPTASLIKRHKCGSTPANVSFSVSAEDKSKRCKSQKNACARTPNCETCRTYVVYGCPQDSYMDKRLSQYNVGKCGPDESSSADSSGESCDELEKKARTWAADLTRERSKWDSFEADYFDFYDASKFEMSADFDKIYYEAPGFVPFANTINATIKVEKDISVRHFPRIKITAPKDYRNSVLDVMNILNEFTSYAGKVGETAGKVIGYIGNWEQYWGEGRRELDLSYEDGIKTYREIMNKRQKILDNYRSVMDHMFCKKVFAIENDLFELRDKKIPQSSCPANVKEALISIAVGPAEYRNSIQIKASRDYCMSKIK